MPMLTSLAKQPLFHFLLAGALIFFSYQFTATPVADSITENNDAIIRVDRTDLLNFMQYRAKSFAPETFNAQLNDMEPTDVQKLVQDYVREEVLYREAIKMGMETGDYIIRERLVQKVEFLLENMTTAPFTASEVQLQNFYQTHLEDYRVDAVYNFTHIFFDLQQAGLEQAKIRAEELLAASSQITFDQSADYGDPFPFLQNYVDRTRDFVANNFSVEFVDKLNTLVPAETTWQGPIASRYGYHLVLLRARTDSMILPLQEIHAKVLEDYQYESLLQSRREAEAKVVGDYEVQINAGVFE